MKNSTQQPDDSSVNTQLKDLLRNVSTYIDIASEEEKREFMTALENLWQDHRRNHPRKACSMRVTYFTKDWGFIDSIANISTGGVFIETNETFAVGEQMKLVFWPPNRKEPIKAEGQVAWSPPKGIGVKFPTLPSKDLDKMIEAL